MSVSTARRIVGGVCAICNKHDTVLLINFGVFSCYSCRAFFRRAQNALFKKETLICNQDETCNIDLLKRKFLCRKCRYVKCVNHGMDANMVLDEEGRKKRFTKDSYKYKTKKDRIQEQELQQKQHRQDPQACWKVSRPPPSASLSPGFASSSYGEVGSGSSGSYEEDCDSEYRSILVLAAEGRFTPPPSASSSPIPTYTVPYSSSSASSSCDNDRLRILFEVSMRNLDLRLHFQSKLSAAAPGKVLKMSNLEHSDLRLLINSLCSQYHQFARNLDCFHSLSPADQAVLLRQNTPCFIQLVFCKAFNATTGFHQLNSLVAQTICGTENILDNAIAKIEFEAFARETSMFQGDCNRSNIYAAFMNKVKNFPCLEDGGGHHEFHLMATLILFWRNNVALEDSPKVEGLHAQYLEMLLASKNESSLIHYLDVQKLFRLMATLQVA